MKLSNAVLLILTGATIGAVAGSLMAPAEGSKTKKKWIKKAKKYTKDLEDKASKYKAKAISLKENIEGAAHDIKERLT